MTRGLLIILIVLMFSCRREERRAGICISFDDRSIKEWYDMRELLNTYNCRVTFFVTQFDSLDSAEVQMLKALQREGHEIGSHGAMHVLSEYYIKENTYKSYLENEITPAISAMEKHGFVPKSFAYPYGAKYWFTDHMLLEKFKIIRSVTAINNEKDLTLIDDIYYSYDGDRTLSSIGIDKNSGLTREMIDKAIKRAHDNKEVLMVYGHAPALDSDNGAYTFDVDILRHILEEAKSNNLAFLKFEDLVLTRP